MKLYSPGASVFSDYYYVCDCCETDDGRPVLRWESLPGRRGHFALCYDCLAKLHSEYNHHDEIDIKVSRIVIPESLRNRIFDRDGNRCVECRSADDLTIDHVIPFSRGGRTEESNLQTLCRTCNSKKGTKINGKKEE